MPPADLKTFLWFFFGFRGRISREPFVLGLLVMTIIAVMMLLPLLEVRDEQLQITNAAMPILLLANVVQFALVIKRLHDMGKSGFFSIIMLMPVVNLVFALGCGVLPGQPAPNHYGDYTNVPPN